MKLKNFYSWLLLDFRDETPFRVLYKHVTEALQRHTYVEKGSTLFQKLNWQVSFHQGLGEER